MISVTVEVPARIAAPGQAPVPFPVLFEWDSADPWAVTIDFGDDQYGDGHAWTLDRQMLADGLTSQCGEGDVKFRPGVHGEAVMTLEASDPDGPPSVDIHLPAGRVWAFLGQTFDILAPGLESIPDSEYASLLEEA